LGRVAPLLDDSQAFFVHYKRLISIIGFSFLFRRFPFLEIADSKKVIGRRVLGTDLAQLFLVFPIRSAYIRISFHAKRLIIQAAVFEPARPAPTTCIGFIGISVISGTRSAHLLPDQMSAASRW
jgi:hypothetical protein